MSITLTGCTTTSRFDTATTATALGRLRIAYRDGKPFRPGTIAELDGTPIMEETPSRPEGEFIMLPQGGDREHGSHRGYGFDLMAEVLSTMLTGTLPPMLTPDARERCFSSCPRWSSATVRR